MADLQSIKNRFGIIGASPALNYALQVAVQVANTDLTVYCWRKRCWQGSVFAHHTFTFRPQAQSVYCRKLRRHTGRHHRFGIVRPRKRLVYRCCRQPKGYFETVNSGTIFLDEIGEMPLGTQARLLRVLETGEFIRVGSSKVQKTDVRVITATNKDLLQLVQQNKFREDLVLPPEYRSDTRVRPCATAKKTSPCCSGSLLWILPNATKPLPCNWMTKPASRL
jgi:hypothetical protein